jgi:hypothetical protein
MFSFGFMINSISPVNAESNNGIYNSNYKLVPTNPDGSINVKLSSNSIMDVNLVQISGYQAGCTWSKNGQSVLLNVSSK